MIGLLPCGVGVAPKMFHIGLARGQFRAEPCQFGARLIAFERRGDHFLAGFDLLGSHFFQEAFRLLPFGFQPFDSRLQLGEAAFLVGRFDLQRAQFAFGCQRTGFSRAATRDGAPLIAGSIRSQENVNGILASQPLRGFGLLHEESRPEPGQELLCRRSKRIAKFDESVEARNAGFKGKRSDMIVIAEIQAAQGIDKEGGAPAELFAQKGDAGTRVIKGLNNHIFEFVAKKLLHGGFVLGLDFCVVGKQTDGTKIPGHFVAIRGE